jgi:hypothetical protein
MALPGDWINTRMRALRVRNCIAAIRHERYASAGVRNRPARSIEIDSDGQRWHRLNSTTLRARVSAQTSLGESNDDSQRSRSIFKNPSFCDPEGNKVTIPKKFSGLKLAHAIGSLY